MCLEWRHLCDRTVPFPLPPSQPLLVSNHHLELRSIAATRPDRPAVVFLHEGIGSVSMWRDYPDALAGASGCAVHVYSRYGYGQSDVLAEPRQLDYMHAEALEVLPALIAALGLDRPVLYGHSDGASIALMYAGRHTNVRGAVLEAPHVFVEDESIAGIVAAKRAFETTDLPAKLARHHRDPGKTFYGWNDAWLNPEFRNWNIEAFLPTIACPLLAIQGEQDNYGTMAQLDAIARQSGGRCDLLKLAQCGHSPHRDQRAAVLAAAVHFIETL